MVSNRFTFGVQKDIVLLLLTRPGTLHLPVVVSRGKEFDRRLRFFVDILNTKFINFLTQCHSFASTQCFAPLFSRETLSVEVWFGKLILLKLAQNVLFCRVESLIPVRKVLVFEL